MRPGGPTAEAKPSVTASADLAWRDYFTNSTLRKVIDLALSNNRDLRIAALNIERAQALYRMVKVGQPIPLELYEGVAEILAYVYRLSKGQRKSA